MKNELTLKQTKRQDFVDNAIYDLIKLLNPTDEDIFEYDGETVARIRHAVFNYHVDKRSINAIEQPEQIDELEMKFYPYLEENE